MHSRIPRLLVLVLVVAGLAFAPAALADPPAFDVTVINDVASALPVTIEGSDPVPVSIEATPSEQPISIQLSGFDATPGSNTFLVVENVQRICVGSTPTCAEASSAPYVVPAGKTLVIETVSVIGEDQSATANLMSADLGFSVPGVVTGSFDFPLGLTDLIDPGQRRWARSFGATIRVPAGGHLRSGVVWDAAPGGTISASTTISGRLVDAP